MKTEQNFEQKVRKALQQECEGISTSDRLKQRIDETINLAQEGKNMKHISIKKIGFGVAAACLLVSGITFAGRTAGFNVQGSHTPEFSSYAEMDKADEELGYAADYVEHFNNGYTFAGASIHEVEAYDEDRNTLYTFDELFINYEREGEPGISLAAKKPLENFTDSKVPDAERVCGDITVEYDTYTYKFVPPNYELTEEDLENQKKDNYCISYGSDEVEIQQNHMVTWNKDGIAYQLLGFELNLSPDEMLDMAEEIISAD